MDMIGSTFTILPDPHQAALTAYRFRPHAGRPVAGMLLLCGGGLVAVCSRRTGIWGPPKGGVKEGEHPGKAALREVEEEVGLRATEIWHARDYYIGSFSYFKSRRKGGFTSPHNQIHLFAGAAARDPSGFQCDEIAEVRVVPPTEFLALKMPEDRCAGLRAALNIVLEDRLCLLDVAN
jgi:8-oxo-dGTP pyrophosphatase MutT (NUDIX family)